MTSLISALEQRVEKSLSFDMCKISFNVTLLDKAYLFLELAVTADIFKISDYGDHVRKRI